MNTTSARIVALQYHFPLKETGALEEMADSRSGPGNVQDEARTPHHPRGQGSRQRPLGSCPKDPGANLKRLPLVQDGTI